MQGVEIKGARIAIPGAERISDNRLHAMTETIAVIEEAGLRDGLKIIIGAGPVSETARTCSRADAYRLNAMDAMSLCQEWMAA